MSERSCPFCGGLNCGWQENYAKNTCCHGHSWYCEKYNTCCKDGVPDDNTRTLPDEVEQALEALETELSSGNMLGVTRFVQSKKHWDILTACQHLRNKGE